MAVHSNASSTLSPMDVDATTTTTTLEIPIELSDVGRVIGKAGAYIRGVRERSKCEVEVITGGNSGIAEPFVRVKGPPSAVAIAQKLIADVAGGAEVVFLRDLSDAACRELTNCTWLQEAAQNAGCTYRLRGRALRITSDYREKSLNFKQYVGHQLNEVLGHMSAQFDCSSSVADQLRTGAASAVAAAASGRDAGKVNAEFSGPPPAVKEALVRAQMCADKLAGGSARRNNTNNSNYFVTIPVWTGLLLSGCTSKKEDDLRLDLADSVAAPYDVIVDLQKGSAVVTIEGMRCAEAARETKEILQYYFSDNCILIVTTPESLAAVEGGVLAANRPGLSVQMDASTLWVSGPADVLAVVFKAVCAAVCRWHIYHLDVHLPHPRLVGVAMQHAQFLYDTTGCTLHPLPLAAAGTPTIRITAQHPYAPEVCRRELLRILATYHQDPGQQLMMPPQQQQLQPPPAASNGKGLRVC